MTCATTPTEIQRRMDALCDKHGIPPLPPALPEKEEE